MKYLFLTLLCLFLIVTQTLWSQNIVPNNSFEECNTGHTPSGQYPGTSGANDFDGSMIWWTFGNG